MSRVCAICDKSASRANHVSHSNRKVPRRQNPNLQSVQVDGESVRACSSCRRTMVKKMA
ncbi:MAG TPA: L28 family ribosomal protein [Candidatus Udaeobacter sp.]|nr:L28 family ribosomal protein [Candidatus Udaeobacter sp.]